MSGANQTILDREFSMDELRYQKAEQDFLEDIIASDLMARNYKLLIPEGETLDEYIDETDAGSALGAAGIFRARMLKEMQNEYSTEDLLEFISEI